MAGKGKGKMDKQFVIHLDSLKKIKWFVNEASKLDSDVDIQCGRYTIDGKSIMGIFGLDTSKPLTVILRGRTEEEVKTFESIIEKIENE